MNVVATAMAPVLVLMLAVSSVSWGGEPTENVATPQTPSPEEGASQAPGSPLLEFDLRHEANRTLSNNIQNAAVIEFPRAWGNMKTGVRFFEEGISLDKLVYFGEVHAAPYRFLRLRTRLLQTTRIAAESGATVFLATASICVPGETVEFCFELGPQHTWWQIQKRAWLPFVHGTDFGEWDLSVGLSLRVRWTDRWHSSLTLATFENAEIYRFHSPFVQLAVTRTGVWENVDGFVFGRYHIYLGFGILQSWTTGLGVRVPVSAL